MQRIVVLNPKGGSGKTTIATNLAACYAANGHRPALMDLDPQGSSMRWLRKRPDDSPPIHGIAGFERYANVTRSWQLRIPVECTAVILDTPAALEAHSLPELTRGADAVLVPVMPSDIDIHATAKCIADLLLVAKIRRCRSTHRNHREPGAREHARVPFADAVLEQPRHPAVATLRDTQNYLRSAEAGIGIHDMPHWQVQQDLDHWQRLTDWLGAKRRGQHRRPEVRGVAIGEAS